MCKAGQVAFCCCQCALNLLLSIIGGILLLLVIAGIAVYFVYYHNKDENKHVDLDEAGKEVKNIVQNAIDQTKDVLKGLQN